MSTVRDLIGDALEDLGVLASGEPVTASDAQKGLLKLNNLLESWSIESLTVYSRTIEEFSLVANTGSYTIGTGGVFNTSRPVEYENASIKIDNIEYALDILGPQEWAEICQKSLASSIPCALHPVGTYPLDTLKIYPVPSVVSTLVLYTLKPLSSFSSINDAISLPPGYLRALSSNLAIELAPSFGKEPSALVIEIARESKANIKRKNIKETFLKCDPALVPPPMFNIYKGPA